MVGSSTNLDSHKKLSETKENVAYKICHDLGFDLLLTGHQHMEISDIDLHGTHIVQTPHNGSKFIELNLEFDDNKVQNVTSKLIDVELNPNKEMYGEFLYVEEKVQEWLDTPGWIPRY